MQASDLGIKVSLSVAVSLSELDRVALLVADHPVVTTFLSKILPLAITPFTKLYLADLV